MTSKDDDLALGQFHFVIALDEDLVLDDESSRVPTLPAGALAETCLVLLVEDIVAAALGAL